MPQEERKHLPVSIKSQTGGLTAEQIGTVEFLGALLDRAEQAEPSQVLVGLDSAGAPYIRAWFEPVVTRSES